METNTVLFDLLKIRKRCLEWKNSGGQGYDPAIDLYSKAIAKIAECEINPIMSNVCSLGTKSCCKEHFNNFHDSKTIERFKVKDPVKMLQLYNNFCITLIEYVYVKDHYETVTLDFIGEPTDHRNTLVGVLSF